MHLFHRWEYVGLYGEKYEPFFETYGLKVYEGYVCKECGKAKLKIVSDDKYYYLSSLNEKIERLQVVNCRILETFKGDAMVMFNQKIGDKL